MHGSIHPARLIRSRRARLLAVALLSGVLAAGCTGSPGSAGPTASARTAAVPGCLRPPASCYSVHVVRVAYGIEALLERGIDGRGETVTVVAAPPVNGPGSPALTDIRKDLGAFERVFGLPAARIGPRAPTPPHRCGPA